MATKNGRQRSPEEATQREKIRELLEIVGVNSMDDIQQLFRETIAEFMENGLHERCTILEYRSTKL